MADIRDVIRSKYGIDIKETNLLKLYKLESPDIAANELETKFAERRKKWEQGVNGANEKFAERDRAYLEKAPTFEAILRDQKLRKELFAYHSGKKGTEGGGGEVSGLVRKYFSLIQATTKIGKNELEFFLKYFPDEKRNKKSIIEFLKKEYKVMISAFEGKEKDSDKDEEKEQENDKKAERKSNAITNLFAEKSLLKLRQCELAFTTAQSSPQVVNKYPQIRTSLYEYLQIGKFKSQKDFKEYVDKTRAEVYNVRNDFGTEFIPLVDMFNGLSALVEYNDIRDNFEEFKLLVMYPALTPYMYEIGEIKKESLNQLYEVASGEYGFRSVPDFLVSYFNQVYDNFGIYEDNIRKLMKNAEKQAGKEKAINAISDFFGAKRGKRLPANLRIVYALAYWPIHVLAFIFRVYKFMVEKLRYVGVGLGVLISLIFIFNGENIYGSANFFTNGFPWGDYLHELNGLQDAGFILGLLSTVEALIKMAFMYGGVGFVVGYFLWTLSVSLRKNIDLKGIERSFDTIIDNAKVRLQEQNDEYPDQIMKKKLPIIITNAVVTLGIIGGILAMILR